VCVSFHYFGNNIFFQVLDCLLLIALFLIANQAWLSKKSARVIQRILLGVAVTLCLGYYKLDPYIRGLLTPLLKKAFPEVPMDTKLDISSPLILFFLLFVIGLLVFLLRDKTIMQITGTDVEQYFPERKFKVRLLRYASMLELDLKQIDMDTSWTEDYFTPLDTEVEIIRETSRKKKISDLLSAFRKNVDKKIFLVLGDPGSGKSVALRIFTRRLFKEVPDTLKIPLYINLKEWQNHRVWTPQDPPTDQDLFDFILESLKKKSDGLSIGFLEEYFRKMHEYGRFFYILDSFDEIPDLLDADEVSWIIDSLSHAIFLFLKSTDGFPDVQAAYGQIPKVNLPGDQAFFRIEDRTVFFEGDQ